MCEQQEPAAPNAQSPPNAAASSHRCAATALPGAHLPGSPLFPLRQHVPFPVSHVPGFRSMHNRQHQTKSSTEVGAGAASVGCV